MISFIQYAAIMTLAALVAYLGEPRPLALIVGGAAAITETFAAVRTLDDQK